MPMHTDHLLRYARVVQQRPQSRLWIGQSVAIETHQALAYLTGAGVAVPVGTAVTLAPFRHPYEAAVQARSLALLTGHPVVAGLGTGGQNLVYELHGRPHDSSAEAMWEYLAVMRQLLHNRWCDFAGHYYRVRTSLPDLDHPDVELGLAVLGPGMARVAGEVADVAITWLAPPSYLEDALRPAILEGARRAGRPPPRIVSLVPVGLARPGRAPGTLLARGHHAHLRAPHYRAMLRRAGISVSPGNPESAAEALIDAGAFAFGDLEQVARALHAYAAAGAGEVVLNTAGALFSEGTDAALGEVDEILATLDASTNA